MKQELEIEYKLLLTKTEYNLLLNKLPFPTKPVSQTNYYFETEDSLLKKNNCALRIREKNNTYTLTLKQPNEAGILESHKTMTKQEAEQFMNGNIMDNNDVIKILELLNIPKSKLIYYGHLTTERQQYKQSEIIYVLDKSFYNDHIDYELEIEAPTKTVGEQAFQSLINKFNIMPKDTKPKIARFFNSLK